MPLTQRSLDYLVVASAGDRQLATLPRVIERFPVKNMLWSGSTHARRSARDLQDDFADQGIYPVSAETGQSLAWGMGLDRTSWLPARAARGSFAPGMGQLSRPTAPWIRF